MKYPILSGLLAVSLLAGCASNKDHIVPDVPAAQLYSEAQTAIHSGNWQTAKEKLEALDSRYPFGAYSKQVQLDLIYTYYKSGDLALAHASITRFTRLNPVNDNSDWLLYMSGLTYMAEDYNFMQSLFDVDRSDRNPIPAQKAFASLTQLLKRYPDSPYAADAHQRVIALKNRLAHYDLAVADFYLRRKAWIASIKRCQELQKTYPDTIAARKSLPIQLAAYKKLGLKDAVAHTEQLIKLNPVD